MTAVDCAALSVFVPGRAAPQGSKHGRPIYKGRGDAREFTGKVAQVESSKAVQPWRQDVREACLLDDGTPVVYFAQGVAVRATLVFVMPRPASLPKRKPTPLHTKRPDLDKLIRAVFDAIGSAGIWHDDAQVVRIYPVKRYAEIGESPGCHIVVQAEQEQITACLVPVGQHTLADIVQSNGEQP